MTVEIRPGRAVGTVAAPGSKSMAHRLLICAGLCAGVSRIQGVSLCEDVLATMDCLRQLGVSCQIEGGTVTVQGTDIRTAKPEKTLCCKESGSTLRFLIPLALLCGEETVFAGTEKLFSRPLSVYARLCEERGYTFVQSESGLRVKGNLAAGTFCVPGNISSQFITGLLLALPLLNGDSEIHIEEPVESRGYIDLTLQAMEAFGVHARWKDGHTLAVTGNQRYQPGDVTVEGDHSGAAFFGALNALGGDVSVTGLCPDSLQGDRVYETNLEGLCAGRPEIDLTHCPDLGPVLFAVAAAKNGAVFTGIRRLRLKESDRVAAMAQELSAFGVAAEAGEDRVVITPTAFHPPLRPLDGHNDHRIVMALAVLLTHTGGKLEGAQAVKKSFPDFFEKLMSLGIEVSIQ